MGSACRRRRTRSLVTLFGYCHNRLSLASPSGYSHNRLVATQSICILSQQACRYSVYLDTVTADLSPVSPFRYCHKIFVTSQSIRILSQETCHQSVHSDTVTSDLSLVTTDLSLVSPLGYCHNRLVASQSIWILSQQTCPQSVHSDPVTTDLSPVSPFGYCPTPHCSGLPCRLCHSWLRHSLQAEQVSVRFCRCKKGRGPGADSAVTDSGSDERGRGLTVL